jgi:CubicO group peptidase (beta-lactamase class C family)
MSLKKNMPIKRMQQAILLIISAILVLSILTGCGPSTAKLAAVDFAPLPGDDWEVSTPAAEGLDPDLLAELYYNASELETIYSLLVIKNGKLIAEDYFNEGSAKQQANLQSASKSFNSALVGIALEKGCLSSVDQKMMEFFPEYADQISDPRKAEITIRHMLQMRSGFPWEESDPALFDALYSGEYMTNKIMVHFPLVNDPGTAFHYSNLTTYWLGVIVARACDSDLKIFAEENLFSPLGMTLGEYWQDESGYYYPNVHFTARDAAKYGQLYLNDGEYEGHQIISADWVRDSLKVYSEDAWTIRVGRNYQDIGYGYQWWSARGGDHHYNLALGHGGQQIVLLDEYDMVIVVTADPFWEEHSDRSWKHEKANINLVADFIASLPIE